MENNQFARVGKILGKSLSNLNNKTPFMNNKATPEKGLNNQLPYSLPKVS